jgi:hypothetical protein
LNFKEEEEGCKSLPNPPACKKNALLAISNTLSSETNCPNINPKPSLRLEMRAYRVLRRETVYMKGVK